MAVPMNLIFPSTNIELTRRTGEGGTVRDRGRQGLGRCRRHICRKLSASGLLAKQHIEILRAVVPAVARKSDVLSDRRMRERDDLVVVRHRGVAETVHIP